MAKVTVTFIKNHPSGLKEGSSVDTTYQHAVKLAKGGYISEDNLEIPKDEENASAGSSKDSDELEFITVKLTEEDLKEGLYKEFYNKPVRKMREGDVISVPNPNFKPVNE